MREKAGLPCASPSQTQLLAQLRTAPVQDEATVKKKIMETYGFVDKETDLRYHRPNLSKKGEDKKMTRYRDGKIVSTKGERFSQVTKEESEEMKKTIAPDQPDVGVGRPHPALALSSPSSLLLSLISAPSSSSTNHISTLL